MIEYVLPVEIVLNPPDVILSDIYMPKNSMFFSTYRVMYLKFGANAVRFLGLNSEENRVNELKTTYLLWNRSFYFADMFVKPVGISSIMYSIEIEKIPNIITSVLVPLIVKLDPYVGTNIMYIDFSNVIGGYDGLNTISNIWEPTALGINNFVTQDIFTGSKYFDVMIYKSSFLMTFAFKPKNINLINYYIKNIGGIESKILTNINIEIRDAGNYNFELAKVVFIDSKYVSIKENIYKNFVKIITREKKIYALKNSVYLEQPITFESKG